MALRESTREDYAARIARVERFLEKNLDDDVDPSTLARTAHLSLHHFHRIFRAQLGETIMQHLRRLRLERAARRLRNADDGARLLDLAMEAGYDSHEAFTRAFQARFGVPPSAYRDEAASEPSPRFIAWQAQRIERPSAPVSVRSFDVLRVLCMRHRGSYATVGETWGRMLAWAGAHGFGGAPLYGICPDDPDVTEEARLRFDAAVVVPEPFVPTTAGLAITEIPAGSTRPTSTSSGAGSPRAATSSPPTPWSSTTSTIPRARRRRTSAPRSAFASPTIPELARRSLAAKRARASPGGPRISRRRAG